MKKRFFSRKPVRAMILIITVIACCVGIVLGAGWLDNSYFEITFYHTESDRVQNPMRIVLLSDLHNAQYGVANQELIDAIERLQPDLIAMVGDMNNDYEEDYSVPIKLINSLMEREIAPLYYVYGNHEFTYIYTVDKEFDEAVKNTGVMLLRNNMVTTEIAGNTVTIGGLRNRVDEYAMSESGVTLMENMANAEGFRLLLVHYPEYFLGVFGNGAGIDMALCGHAHGGGVRLPKIGALYSSGQGFFPEFTDGMRQFGGCSVIVSRGLGGRKFPPRINNQPELVVIDVNSKP